MTVSGVCVKKPSNESLAHWSVCSMALGKFFNVQIGIDFSGGSWDELYDSVMSGKTT